MSEQRPQPGVTRRTFLTASGAGAYVLLGAWTNTAHAVEPLGPLAVVLQNGFLRALVEEGVLRELRADPSGQGRYGASPFLSPAKGLGLGLAGYPGLPAVGTPVLQPFTELVEKTADRVTFRRYPTEALTITYKLAGRTLEVLVQPEHPIALGWTVPFALEGYYDVDLHRVYSDPKDPSKWSNETQLVRQVVGRSGHTQCTEMLKRTAVVPGLPVPPGKLAVDHLNAAGGILLVGDRDMGWDLDIGFPDGADVVHRVLGETSMGFTAVTSAGRAITLGAYPSRSRRVPGDAFETLTMTVAPDVAVVEPLTAKRTTVNALLPELLQQGMYHNRWTFMGEWLISALEIHRFSERRSGYLTQIRNEMLRYAGNLGWDRYGRFGLLYCWETSPNYGNTGRSGEFLDPSWDMRHVQVADQYCLAAAEYFLQSGDRAFLDARRERWVALDDGSPVCGAKANVVDGVLHRGDFPLTDTPPTRHVIGQSFIAPHEFGTVTLRLANREPDVDGNAVVRLYDEDRGGKPVELSVVVPAGTRDRSFEFVLPARRPPGRYRITLHNARSGEAFHVGEVAWWTDPAGSYKGGAAHTGKFHGSLWEQLQLMFDYTHTALAADRDGVCSYPEEYGYSTTKSGRVGAANNSYWEGLGNGTDAYVTIWHGAAAAALAEVADRRGDAKAAAKYRAARDRCAAAFDDTFWVEARDGDRTWGRYAGWIDWDGDVYDYGFAYYNVEAVKRGLVPVARAKAVLRWLDFGKLSPDGGATWTDRIYDLWHSCPPFNTIATDAVPPIGGTLPWRRTLPNGGGRQYAGGIDLVARTRVAGPDNAWERARGILTRYARPDRLTGGRSHPDVRGRWHFGDPFDSDLADVEGFREIFTMEGMLGVGFVEGFLGLQADAAGFQLRPSLPAALDRLASQGIGFERWVLAVTVESRREPVGATVAAAPTQLVEGGKLRLSLLAKGGFDRVSLTCRPPKGATAGVALVVLDEAGATVAETWLAHAADGDLLSALAPERLGPGRYSLLVTGEVGACGFAASAGAPRVELSTEELCITLEAADTLSAASPTAAPPPAHQMLASGRTRSLRWKGTRLTTTLAPGESVRLIAR